MRKASAIQKEAGEIQTVKDLTGVFESISSTHVAKIKTKVEISKEFFNLLWKRYSSIRIDPSLRITSRADGGNGRNVFVIISAESGLSGDIDDRLIETMLKNYKPNETDLIVLGTHGATQLKQRGIPYIRYFQVPPTDTYIDVSPVITAIEPYDSCTIYYEEYISLGVQGIKVLDLATTIREMSQEAEAEENIITGEDTIFEPSIEEIAYQMESIMKTLAFSQAILESSLAQDASRFNAMAMAKKRALEMLFSTSLEFHRSKRADSDRRLREVMVGIKNKKRARAAKRHHR
jgi:F-type H+-transporting ATPase subunit gamma